MHENNWRRREQDDLIHQVATPLTNALLFLERGIEKESTKVKKELKLAHEELQKAIKLLQNREAKNLEKTNFSPIKTLENILTHYQKPYQVNCQLQTDQKNYSFYGHEEAFAEIVIHLLNNAAEAYHDHSCARPIQLTLTEACNGMNLIIGDHGRGMNWWQKLIATYPKISFKKVKSGLGLPKVKRLLKEEFDGELKIISKVCAGTLIIAYFPF